MIRKKSTILASIALVIAIVVSIGYYSRNGIYYSYVIMNASDKLTLTFLHNTSEDRTACEAVNAAVVGLVKANCPACTIEKQQCLQSLSTELRKFISADPITVPSARLPNGVITYVSTDPKIAIAACMEGQKQAASAKAALATLICLPSGAPRPISSAGIVGATQVAFRYMAQAIVVLGAGFAVYLAIQFFSARNPIELEFASLPEEVDIKISNIAKRILDIAISIALLILLSPVLILASLLVLLLEGHPIFYISKRYISLDKCITILKFRTMVKDATSPKYRLKERFMRDGYLDIPLSCEVYTPIGRILERTQLVETLQFFNVIFNGMSLVGNRPLPQENIELLKRFDGWEGRFDSPGGITGISQVVGKLKETPQERLELECLYSGVYKSKSGNILLCDALILIYTIRVLLFAKYLPFGKAMQLLKRASGNRRKSI